jgi:hypothetical protein
MQKMIAAAGALVLAATLATPALSGDRRPNAAERAELAGILSGAGFTSWKKVELDDGKWEVDNARHANGRLYDVDIRGGVIVKKDLED